MAQFTPEEIKRFKARRAAELRALEPPKAPVQETRGRGGFLTSLISELAGTGGALGGAAAGAAAGSAVPVIGTIGGGILGGLIGGFGGGTAGRVAENVVRDDRIGLDDALKEGAMSGVFGAAGGGFRALKGAKAASKGLSQVGKVDDVAKAAKLTQGSNVVSRTGNRLFRGTLGIDDLVTPGKTKPNTIFKADELLKEARKVGLKGTPAQMQRQVATQYSAINDEVGKVLSTITKTADANAIKKSALKNVARKLPLKIDNVSTKSELTRTLGELSRLSSKGKISAANVKKFKDGLDVSSAFRKLSGDLASPLTAKETVDMALWKEADNWIKAIAPAAKNLTARQSRLYGLAQGVGRMTRTPGDPSSLSNVLIRTASPTIRSAQSATGRALLAAGESGGKLPGAARLIPGTLARGLDDALAAPQVGTPIEDTGAVPTGLDSFFDQQPQAPQADPSSISSVLSDPSVQQQLLIADLLDPNSQGSNISKLQTIFALSAPADDGNKPLTTTAVNQLSELDNSLANLDEVESLLDTKSSSFGPIQGRLNSLNPFNLDQTSINQATLIAAQNIGRALEGGKLTDADIERYRKALPGINDTPAVAKDKINRLRRLISQQREQFITNQQQFGGREAITPSTIEEALQGAI